MNTFTFDNLHNGKDLFSSIFDKRKNSENKTINSTPKEDKVLQEAKKENISTNLSNDNQQLTETTSTTIFTGPEMYLPKSQEPEEINSQDALDGLSSWSQLFELEKQATNQRLDEINKAWEEHEGPQVDKAKITQEIEEAWSIRKEQKKQEETENLAFYTLSGPNINLSSTKETNKFICDMLKNEIIIDTTIWEDEKLDFFWMQLIACHERVGKKIVLDSSVWNEINCQNQSPITSHHYAISQIAINRIKNLISKNLLSSNNFNKRLDHWQYGCNKIIANCVNLAKEKKKSYVLTNELNLILHLQGNSCLLQNFCQPVMVSPTAFAREENSHLFKLDLSELKTS